MHPLTEFIYQIVYRGLEKFGRYYSCYRGYVINNDDPEKLNRLQLKVPNVYGNQVMEYWAWPKNCFSGPGYGCQVIPPKKDMVWVEFEMGDTRRPIWGHGHFGKPGGTHDIPKKLQNIKIYWFKTPGGHLLEFDDDAEEIRVTHSDTKAILIIKKDHEFIFNGGSNKGLVKVKELTTRLNNVEKKWNAFVTLFNLHNHTGNIGVLTPYTGSPITSLSVTSQSQIENVKIKH